MQDEQPQAEEPKEQNQTPALRTISKKLSRKHKRFCDAYLLTLNATEAYKATFKPKCPEYAYKNAYKVLRIEGVARYIEEALNEASDSDYRPEAIKQGIRALALTATRDADKLRALELMSRISGLLTDQSQTQVNVFTDDILSLAKKRLADRKNTLNVNSIRGIEVSDTEALSTKCPESRGLLQPISTQKVDIDSGPVGLTESVLSINEDSSASKADTADNSADSMGSDEGSPGVGGSSTPTHPSKYV